MNGFNLDSLKRYSLSLLALFLYALSLLLPAFSGNGESYGGYLVLSFGVVQSVMYLLGALQLTLLLEVKSALSVMVLALPWLANLFFLTSFALHLYKQRHVKIVAILALICAITFFLKPQASIGQTMAIVEVSIHTGAYIWLLSTLVLVIAVFKERT